MAITARKIPDVVMYALVQAWNDRITANLSTNFHLSVTQTQSLDPTTPTVTNRLVTAAASSSEATAVTLANDLKAVLNDHFRDAAAHDTEVSDLVVTPNATNLATAITLGNALKAAYNTHLSETDVHYTDDSTNAIAASNATDQATANTLLNEMRTDCNAHIVGAPAATVGNYINVIAP